MSEFMRDAEREAGKYGGDAERWAREHPQEADKIVRRAGEQVDERTGDRYQKQTQEAERFAEDHIEGGGQER